MGSLIGISGGFATAAAAAGVAALGIAVKFSETAAKLDELSQSTGVSVENLSLLGDVAKTKGIGVDEMGHALQKMARSAFEASTGSGHAGKAFADLGISVTNANGSMKPTVELFNEVAAKFKDMPDGPRKTAEAMQIFGRGAANLISVLNMSGEKLNDLEKHFTALNDVISGPTAAASAELKEQMSLISGGFEGIENEITKELVPALLVVTKEMVGAFEGQQDNIKFIVESVAGIAKALLNAGQAAALLGELLGEVLTFGVGFKQLGEDIQKVAGAMISAAHGDWKGAYEGMREAAVGSLNSIGGSNQRIVDDIKASIKSIGDVWTATLPAGSKPNNQEGASAAQPIVEYGAKDEYQMFNRYKKEGEEYEKLKEQKIHADEEAADIERKMIDVVAAEFRRAAIERMKLGEEEHLKNIENSERDAASKTRGKKESVTGQADLGLIGRKEELRQLIGIDQQEIAEFKKLNDEKLTVLQEYLASQRSIQEGKGGAGNDVEADKAATRAQEAFNRAQIEGKDHTDALTNAIIREQIALAKNPFTEFIKHTKDVHTAIQENIVHALDGVTSGLSKTIVEGKNFGAEMKQIGIQTAESFVDMELKRLMAHVMTEIGLTASTVTGTATREAVTSAAAHKDILKDAKKAGAKGWGIGEEFPFPLNVIMPPILAATMFAGVMAFDAFEGGGIVDNTGLKVLHAKEMVLPAPIAEKVQKMADPDSGGGRRRNSNVNITNHISTPNANSFMHSQTQIDAKTHAAAAKAMRRNGG